MLHCAYSECLTWRHRLAAVLAQMICFSGSLLPCFGLYDLVSISLSFTCQSISQCQQPDQTGTKRPPRSRNPEPVFFCRGGETRYVIVVPPIAHPASVIGHLFFRRRCRDCCGKGSLPAGNRGLKAGEMPVTLGNLTVIQHQHQQTNPTGGPLKCNRWLKTTPIIYLPT